MKTSQYIIALLAGMAALSCVKEAGNDLPAPEVTDLITIKAAMPADATTKAGPYVGLSWGWQAGDKLAVTGAEDTQIYTINDGFTAKYAEFTGRPVAGDSFTIQYPDNAASADWSSQAQTGNGGYDHLKYVAALTGVDNYFNFSFSPAWAEAHGGSLKQTGVLKMVIALPDTVSAVKGVTLSAEEPVFYKGNGDAKVNKLDLTVTEGVPDNRHVFTAWFTTSWNEASVAQGAVLTVSVKTAGSTISKEITFPKESVLQTGVVNVFDVDGSGWAQPSHYPSGNGTAEKPWVIMTPEQMQYMADDLAAGEMRYFQLGADVDMAGIDWIPLNNVDPYNKLISLDGCGHSISNLTVGECAYASFAGVLYGSIKDVTFVDAKINAGANVAGVVAGYVGKTENLAPCSIIGVTVKNSTVSGSVNNVGGFIGVTDLAGATFENCTIEGGKVAPTAGVRYVGGFVANINKAAVFKNCTVKDVTIDASASNRVAGFAGQAGRFEGSVITGCVVENVTISAGQNSAGFVGVDYGPDINKCAVIGGTITGSNTQIGGFVAYPEGNDAIKAQITDCYSTMNVAGGEKANIGGFIGIAKGNIIVKNCYAAGEVTGTHANTGIFAGSVNVNTAAISSCIGWNATLPFAGAVAEESTEVKDNYAGADGTISAKATQMGWSADVWDFSADAPKLK
jgi:hypothetical protein